MKTPATKTLLTSIQVAEQLNTCRHTIMRLKQKGLLQAVKIGPRLIRYRQEDVDRLIEQARRKSDTQK